MKIVRRGAVGFALMGVLILVDGCSGASGNEDLFAPVPTVANAVDKGDDKGGAADPADTESPTEATTSTNQALTAGGDARRNESHGKLRDGSLRQPIR